ncbi:hypothetical protein AC1031_016888 [Aphanomyces cochlioides]|nr:hypothetical protein AC1031_016888 [Aphanomyces cochlioides]
MEIRWNESISPCRVKSNTLAAFATKKMTETRQDSDSIPFFKNRKIACGQTKRFVRVDSSVVTSTRRHEHKSFTRSCRHCHHFLENLIKYLQVAYIWTDI